MLSRSGKKGELVSKFNLKGASRNFTSFLLFTKNNKNPSDFTIFLAKKIKIIKIREIHDFIKKICEIDLLSGIGN